MLRMTRTSFRLTFISCEFANADSEIALICPVTMSIKFPIEVYYAALTAYCFSSAALTKQQWKSGDECKMSDFPRPGETASEAGLVSVTVARC